MQRRAFTLIEILVVVTIIGLLAVVGITAYTSVNKQARDVKRKGDLDQIRAALEIFKNNSPTSSYPDAAAVVLNCSSTVGLTDPVDGNVYLSKMPQDPRCASGTSYYYLPVSASGGACNSAVGTVTPCTDYTIAAPVETSKNVCVAGQCGGTGCTYCLGPLGQK